MCIPKVVTRNRLAKEYNTGLEAAKEAVHQHNQRMRAELCEAGVPKKHIAKALLPEPMPCPENLNMRFVRKFLSAFHWKQASRNTSGNYLASCLKTSRWVFFFKPMSQKSVFCLK